MNPVNRATALLLAIGLVHGCGPAKDVPNNAPEIVATITPLRLLLEPVVGDRAEVVTLVPPGASPHTYDLKPSDARRTSTALGLIYVGESLDGWAARLDTPKRLALLPGENADAHDHNPHVWLDTREIRERMPRIVDALAEWDPEGADTYRANWTQFAKSLEELDNEIASLLEPLRDKAVIEFHPSMTPLLSRYGIETVGYIEDAPGHEPSPRGIQRLIDAAREHDVAAIVLEPQLPEAPVQALAEATGAPVVELDPIGGVPGRNTYADLLRFNARRLAEAIQ